MADFVRDLKKSSAVWVHERVDRDRKFAWQAGYAAFTVSTTSCEAVRDYISRQEEHHRVRTFREEFVAMLEKAKITFDPRYLD